MWAEDNKDGRVWEGRGGQRRAVCRDYRSTAAMQ